MTRFGIDALTAIRLAEDGASVAPQHQLVTPSLMRSEALAILYGSVRRGERPEKSALATLRTIAGIPMRVLGDRMSRATAWRIAAQLDWDDPAPAEYLAVARLQADALVTVDPRLLGTDVVPLARYEALLI